MEYSLKLALRSATAKVLSVHALHSAEASVQFEKDNVGGVVLDSWVYTPALPEDNSVQQIAAHGGRFRIADPSQGALFTCGAIRLHPDEHGDEYSQRNRPGGAMQLEFLHIRLCTGQSFPMERGQIGKHSVPDGYQSIKVHNEDDNDPHGFYHEYIVNKESRVWPDFIVNCVYDPEEDRRGMAPGVGAKVANWRIHCYQDMFGKTMEQLEAQRRKVEERKQTIATQLSAIDETMNDVTANHKHVQDKIYSMVQKAVQMLDNRTQAKLNLLQSDDVELRRQLQAFEWMDSFFTYQKALLERGMVDPVEFLQSVQQHCLVVEDAPCEIVDSYNTIHADTRVTGDITVLIDETHHQPRVAQYPYNPNHHHNTPPRPRPPGPVSTPAMTGFVPSRTPFTNTTPFSG